MSYVSEVVEITKAKNSHEPEFLQAMEEVLSTIEMVVDKNPKFKEVQGKGVNLGVVG